VLYVSETKSFGVKTTLHFH